MFFTFSVVMYLHICHGSLMTKATNCSISPEKIVTIYRRNVLCSPRKTDGVLETQRPEKCVTLFVCSSVSR